MYELAERKSWNTHLAGRSAVHNLNVAAAIAPSVGFQWRAVRQLKLSNAPDLLGYQIILPSETLWLTIQEYDSQEAALEGFAERLAGTNTPVLEPFNCSLNDFGDLAFVDFGLNAEGHPLVIVFVRGNLLLSLQAQGAGIQNLGNYAAEVDRFFGLPPENFRKPDERISLSLTQFSPAEKSFSELEVEGESFVVRDAWIRIFSEDAAIQKIGNQIFLSTNDKGKIKAESFVQLGAGIPMQFKLKNKPR